MLLKIVWIFIAILLFMYVIRLKYRQHKKPPKQWEGRNPNEQTNSIEELRQNENKHRKPDGGSGGF